MLATVAASIFAVGASVQSQAVGRAVADHQETAGGPPVSGTVGFRAMSQLLTNPTWLASMGILLVAGTLHAVALALAPISIIQPIGVLAIPFAVLISARKRGARPPAAVMVAVSVTMLAVLAFVLTAASDDKTAHHIKAESVALGALGVIALACFLAVLGTVGPAWIRCLAWAAAGAVVYGLASALLRTDTMFIAQGDLFSLHVLVYTVSFIAGFIIGGWLIQHAHANGPPAVVLGSLTVVDPIVAVVFGRAFLGEGSHLSPLHLGIMVTAGLAAALGVVLLARHHPEGEGQEAHSEPTPADDGHTRSRDTGP